MNTRISEDTHNTKTPESDKTIIPLLPRSNQWVVAERVKNQVTAVCL